MAPSTFGMYLVNWLTFKSCSFDQYIHNNSSMMTNTTDLHAPTNVSSLLLSNNMTIASYSNKCASTILSNECKSMGGECVILVDAYYYLTGIFAVIGLIWIVAIRKMTVNLNNLPKSEWSVKKAS